MAGRPIQQQTLREMFVDAERLTRELIEHLDQGFLPKSHELERLVRPINGEPPGLNDLEDVTVRTQVARLLESDTFTDQVYESLNQYCVAIDNSTTRILTEG
ncbi:MAG: hypothetical protein AB7O26_09210 [Planctomycetaceae bacterium]